MSDDLNDQPFENQAGTPPQEADDGKIKGVFSTQTIQKVGTGTTTRKTVKKTFWFVREVDDDIVEIQPLNVNFIPSGAKKRVAREDFLEKFSPEPEFYISTVYPKMKELDETVVKGEKHREKGETFSAEMEFGSALKIDEENIRANFGLGLTYMDRGEDKKANDIFNRLVKLDAAFEPEHKHLFNEFGINLRKNKMLDQSQDYYKRAMELVQDDENLHYNIARVFFEKQDYKQCVAHLHQALKLNPELEEARKFLQYLKDKGMLEGKPPSGSGGASGYNVEL